MRKVLVGASVICLGFSLVGRVRPIGGHDRSKLEWTNIVWNRRVPRFRGDEYGQAARGAPARRPNLGRVSEMTTHELKAHPEPFAALLSGAKTHEVRFNDRGFEVGDRLLLREYCPGDDEPYTGRELELLVTYISKGGTWGLPAVICVMSVKPAQMPLFDNGEDKS